MLVKKNMEKNTRYKNNETNMRSVRQIKKKNVHLDIF